LSLTTGSGLSESLAMYADRMSMDRRQYPSPSVRSARPTRRAARTSRSGWLRVRPRWKPSDHSSVMSETPCIGSSSSTHRNKGPGGQAGTTHSLRDWLCTLEAGSSAKSLPDPYDSRRSRLWRAAWPNALETPRRRLLTQRGFGLRTRHVPRCPSAPRKYPTTPPHA
jgi:hypothetical protein